MAISNPASTISFTGVRTYILSAYIDDSTITYDATLTGGSAAVGKAVTLSASKTVALADDGDSVFGVLLSVDADGLAGVGRGMQVLPGGDGATLTPGLPIVGDQDSGTNPGFIRVVNSAVAAELAAASGIIVDASTATAVVVYFP